MITYILLFLVILIILCLAISNKRKTKEGFLYEFSTVNRNGIGAAADPNWPNNSSRGGTTTKLGRCEADCDAPGGDQTAQCGRGLTCYQKTYQYQKAPTCHKSTVSGRHDWDPCVPKNPGNYLDSFRNKDIKFSIFPRINMAPKSLISNEVINDINNTLQKGAFGIIRKGSRFYNLFPAGAPKGVVSLSGTSAKHQREGVEVDEIYVIAHMPNLNGTTTLDSIWQTTMKYNYSNKLSAGDVLTIVITKNSRGGDKIARVNYPWRNTGPGSSIYRVKGGISPSSYNFVNDAEFYKQITGGKIKNENGSTAMYINNLEKIYPYTPNLSSTGRLLKNRNNDEETIFDFKNDSSLISGVAYNVSFKIKVQDQNYGNETKFSIKHYDENNTLIVKKSIIDGNNKNISHQYSRNKQDANFNIEYVKKNHKLKLFSHRVTSGHSLQRLSKPIYYISKAPKRDCIGTFEPCNSSCKKTYRITQAAVNGGSPCKYGGNVIKDGDVKKCESTESTTDACNPINCVGSWIPNQNNPCKISFEVEQPAKFGGTCVNDGDSETLFPGEEKHGYTCPKIGECEKIPLPKLEANNTHCAKISGNDQLITVELESDGPFPGCTEKDTYNEGIYCYRQSTLNKLKGQATNLAAVNQNLGKTECETETGQTYNTQTGNCEGFANIFKRKRNILEGFSNPDLLKKNMVQDQNAVSSKEFIDYLIELLDKTKNTINSPEQQQLEAGTSEEARQNADEWIASKFQSYKNIIGRFYDFQQNTNNRVNTALLRDIIGFDMEYEKKFEKFLNDLKFEYDKYDDNEKEGTLYFWNTIEKEIKLTILALKIFKWKISNEYIKYFLKADEDINNGINFNEDFLPSTISFSDLVIDTNQASSLDSTDLDNLKTICSNIDEKGFYMKKLNEELFDSHTNNPFNDITNYVKEKAKKAKESNTKQCIEMSKQKRNERLPFNGCSQKSFFQKEMEFIFQAPKNDAHLTKILNYGVFVFRNKDNKINFTRNLTKKMGYDTVHQQFSGSASYIKNLSDNVKADNPIVVGFKGSTPNSNSDLTLPYERPRWPLWGFKDIDYDKFVKVAEGFTTLANKTNKFAQKTRRVKHNPINDVISFFKRNIFGNSRENFATFQDATDVKVGFSSQNNIKVSLSKKVEINVNSVNNLWYVHVFKNEEMSDGSAEKVFFDKLMTDIKNDYANSHIYMGQDIKSPTNVDDFKQELFGVMDPIEQNWSKAIVHLYINDDGYSAIVVDIKNEDTTEKFPEVNDSEIIKYLLADTNFLKNDYRYYLTKGGNALYDDLFDSDTGEFDNTKTTGISTIRKNRTLLTIPRKLLHVSFDNVDNLCKSISNGFDSGTTEHGRQTCKGVRFATNCRLNYIFPDDSNNLGALPRCFESDGTTMNNLLQNYEKKCINIAGMKEDGDTGKCITNTDYPGTNENGAKMGGIEHLRSCYLYKDGLTKKCDPGKRDSGDCLCDFSIKSKDQAADANPFSLISNIKGTPIVKDSYCKAVGDKDLSWEQCMEYAGWVLGGKEKLNADKFKSNGFFNDGFRMGCNLKNSSADGSIGAGTEFHYIDPGNRYGKSTRTRRWGEITNIDKGELETLEKYQNDNISSVCMTDYTQEQRGQVASKIDKQEVEIVKGIEIPGIISKNLTTGEPLITELNTLDRDMAKSQCDSKTSWDGCFMTGSTEYLNKGNDMIKDKGYVEYNVYGEYKDDTVEGFRSMREGMANDSSSCKVPNCAPTRFMNGNCDDDVKTTKDVNGIQRFFKLCPQQCLTPIDPRYKDLGWSRGKLDSAGNPIVYDPMKHGCITNKQCQQKCDKTQVQVKHVYDNLCKDDEECSLSLMKSQYDVETNTAGSGGKIKYNSSIKIGMVRLTRDLIKKYGPKQGVATQPGEEGKRQVAIFKYIEEMKKQSVLQIIGMCFKEEEEDANDVLYVIYKKKNVMSKIEINPNETGWVTYIHKRTWKDYWHDPNKPKLQSLDRGLTEEEMQRMQGVNLGISLDAFDAIPLYWQNDKDREVNSADLCEWIDGKIKAGELEDKDRCDTRFKSSWDSKALSIGKTPTKGLNFEEFQQVYNLKDFAEQTSPYTDMSNSMDIGQPDLSLDDFYKRNILKSKVENRLGGSENAYTKTYKPINPNARPRFFDSTWSLFH